MAWETVFKSMVWKDMNISGEGQWDRQLIAT